MTTFRIKVRYAFFCDDVRREDTGKFIFIGVYTAALVVPKFPASVHLTFFVHGRQSGVGRTPFSFRVVYMPGDLEVLSMSATAVAEQVDSEEGAFDFSLGFGFQAQRDGHLSLQLSQDQGPWEELETLLVRQSAH
jgi:hypothetical protein